MINRFFALQFLKTAINIYKSKQDNVPLINALEINSSLETSTIKGNNTQIQTILNAGVSNEKRLLQMEVTDAQQKQKLANSRLVIVLIIMTLLGISFLVYRYYQNQKIVVSKIRNSISQDLHDDIGASLSSLQIYGAVAEKTFTQSPTKALEMLRKISVQSKQLMENMSDIIWSMNLTDAKFISLEAKLKDYSVELLSENEIKFTCDINECVEPLLKKITAKRNILLLIKEAMNNNAKYSHATIAILTIGCTDKHLVIKMKDNGTGFDVQNRRAGNGISNMKKRVEELKEYFTISSSASGTVIDVEIP